MGAPPWGLASASLFPSRAAFARGEACPLRLGVGLPAWPGGGTTPRAPRRSRVPRWPRLEAQAARPLHALSLCSAPDLGAVRLGARSRVGRGRSGRKDRLIPRPSSRRPRGDRAAGEPMSAGVGLAAGWWLTCQRGHRDVPTAYCACRSELRAGATGAAVQGTRGPFLLPAPACCQQLLQAAPLPRRWGRLQTPPAARTPPTAPHPPSVWASRRKYSAAPSPRTPCPGPADLPLTLAGAPTLIPSAPPSFCRPRPSLERPVYYFLLLRNQAPQDPFRTLAGSP